MAGTYNKVTLVGRLGRDPELRYTQSGTPVANLNLATDESYTDKQGNRQQQTEWHRVVVWNKQAGNVSNYLSKGSLVLIEGSLQTKKWQDQQGNDRYTTEIRASRVVFMENKNSNQGQGQGPDQGPPSNDYDPNMGPAFPNDASNIDEAPFMICLIPIIGILIKIISSAGGVI